MKLSRLDLNAYVMRLMKSKGADEEAREALAQFAKHNMQIWKPAYDNATYLPAFEEPEKEDSGFTFEPDQSLRIGSYKLAYYGKKLDITDTRAFDERGKAIPSETGELGEWRLQMSKEGKAEWFGVMTTQQTRSLEIAHWIKYCKEKIIFKELWPEPDKEHFIKNTIRLGGNSLF